jgi:hypothetical protein
MLSLAGIPPLFDWPADGVQRRRGRGIYPLAVAGIPHGRRLYYLKIVKVIFRCARPAVASQSRLEGALDRDCGANRVATWLFVDRPDRPTDQ